MAYKPYTFDLSKGAKCTVVYASQERAEELASVLLNYEKNKEASGGLVSANLEHFAISTHLNPVSKRWELVTIKYNPLTKESVVDSIVDVSGSKARANDAFKLAAIKLKVL